MSTGDVTGQARREVWALPRGIRVKATELGLLSTIQTCYATACAIAGNTCGATWQRELAFALYNRGTDVGNDPYLRWAPAPIQERAAAQSAYLIKLAIFYRSDSADLP